nr:MAG: RNA-dependent RNA polymerase [Army ant associated Nodavirus 2]
MSLTLSSLGTSRVRKSLLALIGLGVGAKLIWLLRMKIVGYKAIGPYPTLIRSLPHRVLQRALVDCTVKRHEVVWYPLDEVSMVANRTVENGHARSGSVRDGARVAIDAAVQSKGWKKYELSPYPGGRRDAEYSPHYAPGDLGNVSRKMDITSDMVVVGIDVDYYVEDWTGILGYPVPAIFHSFQPRSVAGVDGDSPYRIMNDRIVYEVSGGNKWQHGVWDWCVAGEFIRVYAPVSWKEWLLSCLGIRKVQYHKVHHARPWADCPDRVLVWTIPVASHWMITWIECEVMARELKRLKYSDPERPGWNSLVSLNDNNELVVSLGREGEDCAVTLKKADLDVLLGLQSAQSVTSRMIGMGYKEQRVLALVGQYYRKGLSCGTIADRIMRPHAVQVHWPSAFEADAPETSSRVYSTPLVDDENMTPMIKRWEALSNSLEARVTFVANHKVPNKRVQEYAREFVELVVPHSVAHTGIPYDLEYTATELSKPQQILGVKQVWETVDVPVRTLIESFVKNEPCMKSGRIISSYPDMRYLLLFSAYTLKCRDAVLHGEGHKHWFLPGDDPRRIAERVVEYVSGIDEPAETDFSNFDGTVSRWMQRNVMNAIYLRYFMKDFHSELQPYLDMLITCPARAKRFGFKYEPGNGVKSGAPTTCDLNTVADAFVEYVAIRKTMPDVRPEWVMRMLGPKFGDDGITDYRFAKAINWCCDQLGLKVKIERFQPDQGLVFLARVYPNPWVTTTSFQDPLRTWRKLHITARDPNIPLASAACDRLEGYMVTDSLTPVTSDYCAKLLQLYDADAKKDGRRPTRRSRDKEKPYWLTMGGAWPQDEKDVPLMESCICARLGMPIEELRSWISKIQSMQSPWDPIVNDRELPRVEYADTLDRDGLPAEGSVNERQYKEMQDVQCSRANPEAPGCVENQCAGSGAEHKRLTPNWGSQRGKRLGKFQGVSSRLIGQSRKGHESASWEGASIKVPGGGEGGSRETGPTKGNRQAQDRSGQMGSRNHKRGDHRRNGFPKRGGIPGIS